MLAVLGTGSFLSVTVTSTLPKWLLSSKSLLPRVNVVSLPVPKPIATVTPAGMAGVVAMPRRKEAENRALSLPLPNLKISIFIA